MAKHYLIPSTHGNVSDPKLLEALARLNAALNNFTAAADQVIIVMGEITPIFESANHALKKRGHARARREKRARLSYRRPLDRDELGMEG